MRSPDRTPSASERGDQTDRADGEAASHVRLCDKTVWLLARNATRRALAEGPGEQARQELIQLWAQKRWQVPAHARWLEIHLAWALRQHGPQALQAGEHQAQQQHRRDWLALAQQAAHYYGWTQPRADEVGGLYHLRQLLARAEQDARPPEA